VRRRLPTLLKCLGAGALVALAMPPWGWWPLAFVGIALLDRLIADRPRGARFRRGMAFGLGWLVPGMFWMIDLTLPGWVMAELLYSSYLGVAMMLTPPGRGRRLALPAALLLFEMFRWAWPFGGVPLATLPMSQAASPLLDTARLAGALGLVFLVGVGGVLLSAVFDKEWRTTAVAGAVLAGALVLAAVAPTGHVVGELDVAIVQGGGPQRTRAADTDEREVFERHLEASEDVDTPVDLVIWPENVVNVEGAVETRREGQELSDLAQELEAPLIVGVVEGRGRRGFDNAAIVWDEDGEIVDRYDKVRRVPFGEFVPLRNLLETVAPGAGFSSRDAIAGDGPAELDSPVGPIAVAISWEIFFGGRAREGVQDGGEILLNPTNGSSYWLTILQTQQVASSRLRAVENGRWVLQAAPTGFSAVIDPDGTVLQRTGISEREVLHATVDQRQGLTWATRVGDKPVIAAALLVLAAAWLLSRKRPTADLGTPEHQDGAATSPDRETTDLGSGEHRNAETVDLRPQIRRARPR
jgi:apolipoprotein N-acyltransferase